MSTRVIAFSDNKWRCPKCRTHRRVSNRVRIGSDGAVRKCPCGFRVRVFVTALRGYRPVLYRVFEE